MTGGSLAAPFLIGLLLADLLHGVPINGQPGVHRGSLTCSRRTRSSPALTLTAVCVLHGATFLALKTAGRGARPGRPAGPRVAPAVALIVSPSRPGRTSRRGTARCSNPVELTAIFVLAAAWLAFDRREGWAFTATDRHDGRQRAGIFADLYPRVMVSTTSPAYSLTVNNTASGSYSLEVMTIVAVMALPFVLALPGLVVLRVPPPDQLGGLRRHVRAGPAGGGGRRLRSPPPGRRRRCRPPTRSPPATPAGAAPRMNARHGEVIGSASRRRPAGQRRARGHRHADHGLGRPAGAAAPVAPAAPGRELR